MVKGISRQVIVVHSPEPKLFEQAIFILKDEAVERGVTEEELLREAGASIRPGKENRRKRRFYGPAWACGGAMITGLLWMLTLLL